MRYIYFDDGKRETTGGAFTLPHRTMHGVIGRNSSIPVLRHFHSLIPCERQRVETPEEAGHEVGDTGEEVIFVEQVPKKDKDGNIKRDEDGNILYRDKEYKYPELIATEKHYVPPPPDPLANYENELAELDDALERLGFTEPPDDMPKAMADMRQAKTGKETTAERLDFLEQSIELLAAWAAISPLYKEYRKRKVGGDDEDV